MAIINKLVEAFLYVINMAKFLFTRNTAYSDFTVA